jgi:hypothetical protein
MVHLIDLSMHFDGLVIIPVVPEGNRADFPLPSHELVIGSMNMSDGKVEQAVCNLSVNV